METFTLDRMEYLDNWIFFREISYVIFEMPFEASA